jgi:cytochrome oxidase assembly protein ShyY1
VATETPLLAEPQTADWRFAKGPFWIFSHIFAASVVGLFVVLGLWQLDRLDARRTQNDLIENRLDQPLELMAGPAAEGDGSNLDYRSATATVTVIDQDFVRIGNRSQGGAAGQHVVAIVALADGSLMAVNRGFVPANVDVELEPLEDGPVRISGWLRATVERGTIGATDSGEGGVLPRFDTERVSFRLDEPLPPVWLQIAPTGDTGQVRFPDPVPLPPLDEGPHLSYAAQWFIFAALGVAFYTALLRRQSRGDRRVRVTAQPMEP